MVWGLENNVGTHFFHVDVAVEFKLVRVRKGHLKVCHPCISFKSMLQANISTSDLAEGRGESHLSIDGSEAIDANSTIKVGLAIISDKLHGSFVVESGESSIMVNIELKVAEATEWSLDISVDRESSGQRNLVVNNNASAAIKLNLTVAFHIFTIIAVTENKGNILNILKWSGQLKIDVLASSTIDLDVALKVHWLPHDLGIHSQLVSEISITALMVHCDLEGRSHGECRCKFS